jgi:hypothetical protein
MIMSRCCALVFLIFTGVSLQAQVNKPIQFTEESFDFGNVIEEDGPVIHEFVFTNSGHKPVQILSVKPSCGCTTPGWSKEPIIPGKTGIIKASFDPKGRPGFFNKSLTVTTDYDNQPIVLQIKGTVTSRSKASASELKAARGNVRLRSLSFNLGKVYRKDEFVTREFEILNVGNKPITFTDRVNAPAYIRVQVEPSTLAPNGKGMIRLAYNGLQKNQYGFQSDNIVLHSDDELEPEKSFTVYATLEDYFEELKPEELAKAPMLRPGSSSVDFGSLRQNQPVSRELQLFNYGKSPLEIRALVGNCSCLQAVAEKQVLKAGESTVVTITFNPQDRKGTQNKSITVYSNDPRNPVQRITITGVVN